MTTTKKEEPKQEQLPVKKEETASERFTNKVIQQFRATAGEDVELSAFQKRLIHNYFISLDISLKAAEEKRLQKSEQYRDAVPIVWQNVNMESLAQNVVAASRIGFDPALKNHINMLPFKNNHTGKYDIVFMEGYRGMELKATKYGLEVPTAVVIEVVYANDKFKPIKRDIRNQVESYEFEIVNPFDRGEIVGGFYYLMYEDASKNRLQFYNMQQIEKRKPKWASTEFWGGEKDRWVKKDGKNVKDGTEHVDGWLDEMVYKTIARAAYGSITIDSKKIDDNYTVMMANEQLAAKAEAQENGNKQQLDFDDAQVVPEEENKPEENPATPADAEQPTGQTKAPF